MKLQSGQFVVATVLLLFGFSLSVEWRLQSRDAFAQGLANKNLGQLAVMLNQTQAQNQRMSAEVRHLRADLNGRLSRLAAQQTLQSELKRAQEMAGLLPLSGAGVEVVLNDSTTNSGSPYQIHSTDVLEVLNELRAAGAQALSINGQRVIATTEVRSAGGIFSINNTPTAPPFHILALGDPSTLSTALELRGGVVSVLTAFGITVDIAKRSDLTVPAYTGTVPLP